MFSLHSVYDKVYKMKPSIPSIAPLWPLRASKKWNRQADLIYLTNFVPIDYCVRINGEPDALTVYSVVIFSHI